MAKYSKIAVIYGSDSSEWEVSCRSGEFTASRIDENVYDVYEIFARNGKWSLVACRKKDSMRITFPEGARPEIDKTDFSVCVLGEKVKFDFAYIMQHGAPGENGLMQGYLEMLGIPFSTSSAFVSAVVFDKHLCKSYIASSGIVKCSPDLFVREGMDVDSICAEAASRFTFPVFVKPTQAGSSFGITMVKDASGLAGAIRFAFSENPSVIIEQGISGRELTCAVYSDNGVARALPPIEIVTNNEYFDYDAKYNGNSSEICPAPISDGQTALLQKTSCELYSFFGCNGVVRMDYIMAGDELYFLEVNAIPGMTSASLVPKMVRAAGINITDFLSTIIENS